MATFGYTQIGAQSGYWGAPALEGCRFTSPADLGTITKITVQMAAFAGTVNAKAFLYADNGGAVGALLATSSEVTGIGTTPAFIDFTINYAGTPNTPYWLCVEANGNFWIYWDNGSTNQGAYQHSITYPYSPSPWTPEGYWSIMQTIYATYTPSGGAGVVSLDGQILTVTKLGESCDLISTQWDAWAQSKPKRKLLVYRTLMTWTLDCIEQNVDWANSLAKYFETVENGGVIVTFYSGLAARPVSNVSVYVIKVTWTLENLAGKNIRKFTLTLQEAQ